MLTFNESVKSAIAISQSLAKEYHNEHFSAAHLLRSLLQPEIGLSSFLESLGKDVNYIRDWAEVRIEDCAKTTQFTSPVTGDQGVQNVFEESDNIRIKLGLDQITPICLLVAIAKPGVGFSPDQLKVFPLKEKEILDLYLKEDEIKQAVGPKDTAAPKAAGFLFKYCVERTALARDGKIDPIVGRDQEMREMMEILCRRTKPNVIIVGEAGVGKTALIDGFALDLVENKVPSQLANSQIYELDLGSIIAGASYKGEIEDRLKNILKEIKLLNKAILFIDEIHILLDSKGPIGAGVGNLLKPELARGEITVIGATTNDEYRKILEPDQAFTRRFEVLMIEEPDVIAAIKMLKRLAPKFEEHHQLKINDEAIAECVRLAKRYGKDRRLPDAAIDLLDRTMSAIKMMNETSLSELTNLKTELNRLQENGGFDDAAMFDEYFWLHTIMQKKISPVLIGKLNDQTETGKFKTHAEFADYIKSTLEKLTEFAGLVTDSVSKQDIASVISYKSGIPIGKIQAQEQDRLLNMESFLSKRVVGQEHALKAVSDAIRQSRSGVGKKGKPGSLFLLGPTGTGKTELAKSTAEFLFNDENAMIRFDMSEFKEEHSAALLYGAPPGYVGFEEGGLLVNKIRQKPYSVVLFDEIEKAHSSVFDVFLPILAEGHMHDKFGRKGDFSNSLIMFTSNIGSEWIAKQFEQGQMPSSDTLKTIMKQYFRPEFLGRLTEIVPFAPITKDNLVKIFDIQLKELVDALDKQGIKMEISEAAKVSLANNGFTPEYGARQIASVISNQLSRPISKYIISSELQKGKTVVIDLRVDSNDLEWTITG
jgi:ATP-dependent Clp protease ATP-binding subunit ClpB